MDKERLIQLVLNNTASEEQLAEFENLITSDLDFKNQYQEAKNIKAALVRKKSDELKQLFSKTDTASEENKSSRSGFSIKTIIPLLAAASVIIFLYMWNTPATSDQLFDNYYEPYRNVITSIERGEAIQDDLVSRALYNYESQNYDLAYKQLDSLYKQDDQSIYLFYKANAALGSGDYENAISLYLTHQKLQDDFFARSRWYLALAYLKNDNKEKAAAILREIVAIKSYNYKNAEKLLEELE